LPAHPRCELERTDGVETYELRRHSLDYRSFS
jgi:hypothetical protein